jgi:hypothetical protein
LNLKPQLTAHCLCKRRMNAELSAFDSVHPVGVTVTRPMARLIVRQALSRLLAGPGPQRRCFVADTRSDTPSDASNFGF